MAYRRRTTRRVSSYRTAGRSRSTYRSRAKSRVRRTASRARAQTIRIVLEQPRASVDASLIGVKPAPKPKVAKF